MKRSILSLILATLCGISAFSQDFLQVNASLSIDNISQNKQKSNIQRNGENAIWSCDFEEGSPVPILTKADDSETEWQIITEADYPDEMYTSSGGCYFLPMNYTGHPGNNDPHQQISETPDHWAFVDAGSDRYNSAPQINTSMTFSGIDLSSCAMPKVTFLQSWKVLNQSSEEIYISVSTDNGATWTDHRINDENLGSYTYVNCIKEVLIPEARNAAEVSIRFRYVGQSGSWHYGWQVDDIKIVEYYSAVCGSGQTLYYTITSSTFPYTVEVSGGDGLSGNLTIPSMVTFNGVTYSVTSIGNYAFYGCSGLTTVTIPNSVTSIGNSAFYNCIGLISVTIGGGVTNIGNSAFYGCSGLTSITIPNSVTSIGNSAFYGCSGLTSVTIGNSVTNIGNYAFYNCIGLTSVTIGSGVTNIGQNAFYGCSGLTTVNYDAANCTFGSNNGITGNTNITTLSIGENVETIPNSAFSGCSGLTTVNYDAANCTFGSNNGITGNTNITTLSIGGNVETIPNSAFSGCSGLSGTLSIPNSVTSISNYAFSYCSGLTSVTLGSGVTDIGQNAFYGCSGLTGTIYTGNIAQWCGITFGNSGAQPLSYSHNLYVNSSLVTDLVIPNTVEALKAYAFYGATCLTSVATPNSVTSIGNSAFYNCSGLTSVTVGGGVTDIWENAFYGCSGLTGTLTIPNSVTSIGNSAFYGCNGLSGNLTVPNSVASIGQCAFYNCNGLTSVTIGSGVTSIGNSAFYGCNGLTTFNFNAENCTGTIDYLFNSNNTLSKITIGENVATIPNNAFKNCISLDSIISAATNPPVIYASTFDSQLSLNTPVVVPCGMVEEYEDADFWYNFRHIQQRADCGATYTIIVMSSNSAWGTVSGGGTYMVGETATLTATPNSGYSFSNWSDGSTENPHTVVVTAAATYIATFVQGGSSNPTVYNSIEATACGSYTWNNQTYTESGEYQQTFTAASSADSIVTLTLTILPAPQPTISLYGELDACNPSSVAFATEQYQSYLWSNGATSMITSTSVPGYYYVEVTDENGCTGASEQICIGLSNALTDAPQIVVVGMNNLNRNVVSWSAFDNENVNAYRIYRENNVANVYEPMATVEASAQTFWTDETADPSARAYRYKITAVDECGGESPMSDYHKTMHLTINQGIGNTWNLIWSHYEGFDFGTYRIYRGTMPSNMTMIGEVPSNLNSYTDNTATASTGFYYQVEVVRNTRSRDAEISSRSNIVDNGLLPEYTITAVSANPNQGTVVGGGTYPEGSLVALAAIPADGYEFLSWSDESTDNPHYITVTGNAVYVATFVPATDIKDNALPEIALFPNPTNDILNITSSETISEIEIVNVMGQVVRRIEINSDNAVCDVNELTSGVYMVRIRTLRYFGEAQQPQAQGAALRKFVKE